MAQLDALSADDIRARYRAVLARDNLRLAVVGDISRAEVRRMMRDVFGALPAQNRIVRAPQDIEPLMGRKARIFSAPGRKPPLSSGIAASAYDDQLFFRLL